MDTSTLSALLDFDNPERQVATLPALNEELALAMDRHEVKARGCRPAGAHNRSRA
jgi:hypothetical protein